MQRGRAQESGRSEWEAPSKPGQPSESEARENDDGVADREQAGGRGTATSAVALNVNWVGGTDEKPGSQDNWDASQ